MSDSLQHFSDDARDNGIADDAYATEQSDARALLSRLSVQGEKYTCIDLDPYGSSMPFVRDGLRVLEHGRARSALLMLTFTDVRTLVACKNVAHMRELYDCVMTRTPFAKEAALRAVLGKTARIAAEEGVHVRPLLSISADYWLRCFVQVYSTRYARDARTEDDERLPTGRDALPLAHLLHCSACGAHEHVPLLLRRGDRDRPPFAPDTRCSQCGSAGERQMLGPVYAGALQHPPFVLEMARQADGAERRRVHGVLRAVANELPNAAYYYDIAQLCRTAGIEQVPPLQLVLCVLRERGFGASRWHDEPLAVKTDASMRDAIAALAYCCVYKDDVKHARGTRRPNTADPHSGSRSDAPPLLSQPYAEQMPADTLHTTKKMLDRGLALALEHSRSLEPLPQRRTAGRPADGRRRGRAQSLAALRHRVWCHVLNDDVYPSETPGASMRRAAALFARSVSTQRIAKEWIRQEKEDKQVHEFIASPFHEQRPAPPGKRPT